MKKKTRILIASTHNQDIEIIGVGLLVVRYIVSIRIVADCE